MDRPSLLLGIAARHVETTAGVQGDGLPEITMRAIEFEVSARRRQFQAGVGAVPGFGQGFTWRRVGCTNSRAQEQQAKGKRPVQGYCRCRTTGRY